MNRGARQDNGAEVLPGPTRLRRRALRHDGDLEVWLQETAARGQAAVSRLSGSFDTWAEDDVLNLAALHDAYKRTPNRMARDAFLKAVHDVRATAPTLGYPLVARLCTSLLRLLDTVAPLEDLVAQHVEAIRALTRERVRGDDHPVAATLAAELERLTATALSER